MEKRVILAFILSTLVLVAYSYLAGHFSPPKGKDGGQPEIGRSVSPAPQTTNSTTQKEPVAETPSVVSDSLQVTERNVTIETSLWNAVISNKGGVITSFIIKKMPNGILQTNAKGGELQLIDPRSSTIGYPFRLELPDDSALSAILNNSNYDIGNPSADIRLEGTQQQELTLTLKTADEVVVTKWFRFYNNRFDFDFSAKVIKGGKELPLQVTLGPGFGDPTSEITGTYTSTPPQAVVATNSKIKRFYGKDLPAKQEGNIDWAGVSDHYFCLVTIPPSPVQRVDLNVHKVKEKNSKGEEIYRELISASLPIPSGVPNKVYAGPKDRELLNATAGLIGRKGIDLEEMIDYGMFSFMVRPLIPIISAVLDFFYRVTHNYGWSILILTVIINMFFFPLKWKSSVAMKKAAKLQPKMKELQEKMKGLKKDDPQFQKLQMQQLQLMKEGNPLSGCLPLLIQLPVFWTIFVLLTISLDVRHAPFVGWIKDLSGPDPLLILPIVMCISMILQSLLTPTPTDPSQKMQKYMMTYIMPVAFTYFFFLTAPSGLVLYWLVSNLVGVGQQIIINRFTPS